MDIQEAIDRAESWRTNPRTRPTPDTARAVTSVLMDHIRQIEAQLATAKRLAVGREIVLLRGNPDRGPETGPGFGRHVPAILVEVCPSLNQVRCRLLKEDPDAVGAPCRAGDEGLWAVSQVVVCDPSHHDDQPEPDGRN